MCIQGDSKRETLTECAQMEERGGLYLGTNYSTDLAATAQKPSDTSTGLFPGVKPTAALDTESESPGGGPSPELPGAPVPKGVKGGDVVGTGGGFPVANWKPVAEASAALPVIGPGPCGPIGV